MVWHVKYMQDIIYSDRLENSGSSSKLRITNRPSDKYLNGIVACHMLTQYWNLLDFIYLRTGTLTVKRPQNYLHSHQFYYCHAFASSVFCFACLNVAIMSIKFQNNINFFIRSFTALDYSLNLSHMSLTTLQMSSSHLAG